MRLQIDVIDADPPRRIRVDDGKVEGFKRHRIENNKPTVNKNVEKIADGISSMLRAVLVNVNITVENGDTERDSLINNLLAIMVEGEALNDSELAKNYIIRLVVNFLDSIAEIQIDDQNKPLLGFLNMPNDFAWLINDEHKQIFLKEILDFQISTSAESFSRKVNVRIGSQRVSLVGKWKKSDLGSRVVKLHPAVTGYIKKFDFENSQIIVKGKDGKDYKIKVISTNFDENLKVCDLFYAKNHVLEVEDHYLEKKDDSELHMIGYIQSSGKKSANQ